RVRVTCPICSVRPASRSSASPTNFPPACRCSMPSSRVDAMNHCDTVCREALQSASPAGAPTPELERLCSLLGQASLFNGLACGDIARFARGVRELTVAEGAILFHRGAACTGIHLTLNGPVRLAFTSAVTY